MKAKPPKEQIEALLPVIEVAEQTSQTQERKLFAFGIKAKLLRQQQVLEDECVEVLESIPGWSWELTPDELGFIGRLLPHSN